MKLVKTTDPEKSVVWAYVINDVEIVCAYTSECGRFDVTPDYYGLTVEQADKLTAANRLA
jgi:hypothetical protein